MTHIVPGQAAQVPVQPVATAIPVVAEPAQPAVAVVPTNNVKFEIKGTEVNFYETSEPFNNKDVFENFDLARAGAVQAFAKHKKDVLMALERTEKDLVTVSESVIAPASNGVVVGTAQPAVTPAGTTARVNSSNVTATPIP